MKKLTINFLLFLCIFSLLAHFCRKGTAQFTMTGIASDLPFDPAWEASPLQREEKEAIKPLFNQKFTFLGSGGQCFVFASEDGNYVLKLFKLYRRRLPFVYKLLPKRLESYREKKLTAKRTKLVRDFGSHVLAFNTLKEETALVYVHLNKTSDLHQKVTLIDRLGIQHQIDLDQTEFVIQKRAMLVYPTLDLLVKQGREEEAKRRIDALIELILSRCKKCVYDEDAYISRNFGFIGEKAIIIDAGRLRKVPEQSLPETYKKDLFCITERLRIWLDQNHPELTAYLLEKRNAVK